jgi:hypothetical protein
MDHIIKEAIQIQLYPNTFNRDSGVTLSQTWYHVTNMLKQSSETPTEKQGQT